MNATAETRRIRLVIVENDEDEREFMKEGFEASGRFDLLAIFRNGDQLLDWLRKNENNRPELILSDLNMPGRNGYDILSHFSNQNGQSIPVVITSTSTTRSIINKCLDMGAADYMIKPDTFVEYAPFAEQLYRQVREKKILEL